MLEDEYHKTYELERTHWWFAAKRRVSRLFLGPVFAQFSARLENGARARRILDVGCGTGGNLEWLSAHGDVAGADLSEAALRFCRRRMGETPDAGSGGPVARRAGLVCSEAGRLPFTDGQFDLVTAFDVLYHEWVRDDRAALREMARVCRPGGWLLVTDAALPFLRGPHDEAYGGARRYTRRSLRDAVESAGFRVVRMSYFHFLLFPVIAGVRLVQKWFHSAGPGRSSLKPTHPFWNALLRLVGAFECMLLRSVSLPWGSSIICLAGRAGDGPEREAC